jgi:hypothetical protein
LRHAACCESYDGDNCRSDGNVAEPSHEELRLFASSDAGDGQRLLVLLDDVGQRTLRVPAHARRDDRRRAALTSGRLRPEILKALQLIPGL